MDKKREWVKKLIRKGLDEYTLYQFIANKFHRSGQYTLDSLSDIVYRHFRSLNH